MTPVQLRALARERPTDIWRGLHALAAEVQYDAELGASQPEAEPGPAATPEADIEALIRATQPGHRRRRWWPR